MRFSRSANPRALRNYFKARHKRLEVSREVQGPRYKSPFDLECEEKIREFSRTLDEALYNVVVDPMCPADQIYSIGLDTLIKSPGCTFKSADTKVPVYLPDGSLFAPITAPE